MGTFRPMHLGPGVYVGPVFVIAGLLLVLVRRAAGRHLAMVWPQHELATPTGVAVLGVSSMIAGGFAVLVGFGLV
jgi:hypothetical protein